MKFTLGTGFSFNDTFITDPYTSECGRFLVSPEYYNLTSTEAQELVTLNERLMLQRRRS